VNAAGGPAHGAPDGGLPSPERTPLHAATEDTADSARAATAAPSPSTDLAPVDARRKPLPDVPVRLGLYKPLRVMGRAVFRLVLDVRVGRRDVVPSSGPVLLAGNHRGILDAPLMVAFVPRPARFIAKSELFTGALARLLGWLGQIPIDRGRPDREALRKAIGVLRDGHVLGMFPEGTRGAGELTTMQHGIAYVALRVPGVTIVPVACLGTERALPKGSRLPRFRSRVDIVFGEPFTIAVPPNPRARSAVAAAAEEIRVALASHVAACERRLAEQHVRKASR
jgi:1-acyl-sn-glycerol-3-phosphate acyltransferase